jgi:hypothetical protein
LLGDAKFKTGKTGKTGNLLNFYDEFWCPYAEVLSRIEAGQPSATL